MVIALLAALAFGVYPPAAKLAYSEGSNPSFLIAISTFSRALALLLACLLRGLTILPSRRSALGYLGGGFAQAVSIFGIITSLAFIPGPVTIIIVFTHTILLLFLLAVRGERQLDAVTVASTASALFRQPYPSQRSERSFASARAR